MKFRTQYSARIPVYQDPGSRVKVVYAPRYDEKGVLDLVETGEKEDLYGYIQSHKQSTDIHYLLNRFVNGEKDILSQVQGFYADASNMPKTYAEVLNAVIAGEESFARLPVEIKQRFDNSFAVWLSSFDSPDFAEKMGLKAETSMTDSQVQDFAGSAAEAPPPAAPVDTSLSSTPAVQTS